MYSSFGDVGAAVIVSFKVEHKMHCVEAGGSGLIQAKGRLIRWIQAQKEDDTLTSHTSDIGHGVTR
ncbi:MAG: hypothetical protein K2Z81_17090 [Cyanobacteria bacterium]|nr:hypothetical protein [Cyanobacteriota bacterium]